MIGHKIWNCRPSVFIIIAAFCFLLIKHSSEEKLNHASYSFFQSNAGNEEAIQQRSSEECHNVQATQAQTNSGYNRRYLKSAPRKVLQTGKHSANKRYTSVPKHSMKPKKCRSVSERGFFVGKDPFIPSGQTKLCFANLNPLRFKIDSTKIDIVISSALNLRSSLLIMFSEILYASKDVLTQTKYSAFFKICDSLRKRKVDTFDLLKILPKIKSLPLKQQLVALTKTMKLSLPNHLIPSVNICVDVLLANKIESILPKSYLVNSNIFSNLGLKVPEEVILHLFKSSALSATSETFIKSISLGIAKGEIALSCNIFTGIMLNLQLESVSPEVYEAQLFLRDTLFQEEEYCHNSIQGIPIALSEPYSLVHSILKNISEDIKLNFNLRECAKIILPYMYLPYIHSEYHNIITNKNNLDTLLSQVVTNTEFSKDVVYSKERILHSIRSSNTDYITNAHFFYYDSPMEKLISKLEQLRREEGFPKYALRHIEVLRSHLIFKAKQWFQPPEHQKAKHCFQIQLLLGSLLSPLIPTMNSIYPYLKAFIYRNKCDISKHFEIENVFNNTLRDAAALILNRVKAELLINATYLNYIEKYLVEYKCFYTHVKQMYRDNGIINSNVIQAITLDFSNSDFLLKMWFSLVNSALQDLPKGTNKSLYWRAYYCLKYSSFTYPLLFNSSHLTSFKLLRKLIEYSIEIRMVQENPYLLHSFSFYYNLMNPGTNLLTNIPLTLLDIKVMLSYLEKNDIKYLPKLLSNVASVCSPRFRLFSNSYFAQPLMIDTFLSILNAVEDNYWKSKNFPCVLNKLRKLGYLAEDSLLVLRNIRFDITLILEYLPKLKYKNVSTLISDFMTPENMSKFADLYFNPLQYSTPTLYLYHCIVTVLRDKSAISNPNLLFALKFYRVYLEYELQIFVETVNHESILDALPTNGDEGLQAVKDFLILPELKTILSPEFQMTKFRTAHSLLQNIVKHVNDTNGDLLDSKLNKNLQIYIRVICFISKTYVPIPNTLLNTVTEVEDLQVKDLVKWEILHSFLVQPELLTILGISYSTLCNCDSPHDMLLGLVDKALEVETIQNEALLIGALTHYKTLNANNIKCVNFHKHDNMAHMTQAIHNLPILSHNKYCDLMTLYVKSLFYSSPMSNISQGNDQLSTRKQFINDLQNYYKLIAEEKHNQKLFPACKHSLILKLMISELPVLLTSKIKQYIINFLSSNYISNVLQTLNLSQFINPEPNVEQFITTISQNNIIAQDISLNEAIFRLRNLVEIKTFSSVFLPDEMLIHASREIDDEVICKLISNSSFCTVPDIEYLLKLSIEKLRDKMTLNSNILQSNKDLWKNILDCQHINKDLPTCNALSTKNSELVFFNTSLYLKTNESIYGNDFLISCLLQFCFYQHIIPKCYINEAYKMSIINKNDTCENNDKDCAVSNGTKLIESVDKLPTFNNNLNNSKDFNTATCLSSGSDLTVPHVTSDTGTSIQEYIPQLLEIKDMEYPPKIKSFLENPHLDDVLGTSFNISQYYTPILKLAAIVRYVKTVNVFQNDKELLDALNLFETALEKKYVEIASDEDSETFDLHAHPNTTDEDKLWHVHRFFVLQPLSVIFGELFLSRSFPTEKDKLKAITEYVMNLGCVQFKVEWYEAFENFNKSLEKHPPPPYPVTAIPDFARLVEKIPVVPNSDIHLPVFAALLIAPNLMNILGSRFNIYKYPSPILKLWAIITNYEESSMKFIYEDVEGTMDKYKTALSKIISKAPNKFILEEMTDVLEMTNDEKLLRITEFLMSNNTSLMIAIRTQHKISPKEKLHRLLEHVMFLDSTQLNPKLYYSLDSFLNLLDQNMDSPVTPVVITNFPKIMDIFPSILDVDDDQYFSFIVGLLTKPEIIQQAESISNLTESSVSPIKMEEAILNLKFQSMLKYAKSKIIDRALIKYIEKCEISLEENLEHYNCN